MNKETKLRIHNITAKATLKFGSEVWVLKKREEQRLEAAQMKFNHLNIIWPPRRCPYFDVVAGLVWSNDPES
jgi:hypothetical protein